VIKYKADYIDTGELDEQIVIEVPNEEVTNLGDITRTWVSVGVVWAKRRDHRSAESFENDRLVAKVITDFTIRYRSLSPTARFVDAQGEVYEIHGIHHVGRRRWLRVSTERKAD
jgi:SPP1 family predicted phage head-tail adaptor